MHSAFHTSPASRDTLLLTIGVFVFQPLKLVIFYVVINVTLRQVKNILFSEICFVGSMAICKKFTRQETQYFKNLGLKKPMENFLDIPIDFGRDVQLFPISRVF